MYYKMYGAIPVLRIRRLVQAKRMAHVSLADR